jgi:hypothetical protein
MARKEFIQSSCIAEFSDESVLECLRIIVPVAKSGRDLTKPMTILVEQGRVSTTEYVPRHVLDVEGAEGGTERMARLAIRAHQGQIKILKDELRALGERYDTLARTCLWAIDAAPHIPGATDIQEALADVFRRERENLTDPEPRQQAEHRDMVPRFTELLNDYEKLAHRDVVPSPPVARDAAARRWKW